MQKDFVQIDWGPAVAEECRRIVVAAIEEDLRGQIGQDLTTAALVPAEAAGRAIIAARREGVMAGVAAARLALEMIDPSIAWQNAFTDGVAVKAGAVIAELHGRARSLLSGERIALNLLGRLSGIATLTARYVAAVGGAKARIYDTRKTTPGWRLLEKFAVRCGGGFNHRLGLHDAVLIKDNHLVVGTEVAAAQRYTPAEAVRRARDYLATTDHAGAIVEIEVDTLDQLRAVLPAGPDIVLLDNMSLDQLREAVAFRDNLNPQVELEASGGVRLETIGAIAATGVDRISAGALTHSAPWLDIGMDWL